MKMTTLWRLALPCLALLVLSGCGGSNPGSPNKTLSGTFMGLGNVRLPGDTVYYDRGSTGQQVTVTDANGQYKFVVPLSTITGSDTLSFYDSAGHLVDIVSVTLTPNTASVNITTVAPPTPPSLP
jgi:hypothetical protein